MLLPIADVTPFDGTLPPMYIQRAPWPVHAGMCGGALWIKFKTGEGGAPQDIPAQTLSVCG